MSSALAACFATRFGALLLLLGLGACTERAAAPPPPSAEVPALEAPAVPAAWMGQWNGPEGTFLRIEGTPPAHQVTVQNLDGPRTFEATAVDGGLAFERDGVQETLRLTDGAATGMKWLADKETCLTVRPGEGYCRD